MSGPLWRFDLTASPSEHPVLREIKNPLGCDPKAMVETESTKSRERDLALKQKVAMAIATGPGKNILMNGFMMYMSGSQINIFSMSITAMGLWNPVNAIMNMTRAFTKVDDGNTDLTLPKLIFVALNLLSLSVAMWKCSTMGLLPVTSADWTSYLVEKTPLEQAGVPVL